MKAAIVVPTIRGACIEEFLQCWDTAFNEQHVIVVEDNPERTFHIDKSYVTHYSWEDIDNTLGANSWIVPRRSSAIRSYGIYEAHQLGPDMIVTMDDDCYPNGPSSATEFLGAHYSKLTSPRSIPAWSPVVKGVRTRGLPYHNTDRAVSCVLNHGLRCGFEDLDAVTQLTYDRTTVVHIDQVIPRYSYFPMCGMNVSFLPLISPLMYFLLMGRGYPYDRFDDIWCGIFMKKICDHLGYWVSSGEPSVDHRKASDVWVNLRKEVPGMEVNEVLWEVVDNIQLISHSIISCYNELGHTIRDSAALKGDYWRTLGEAMIRWASLFTRLGDHGG